jgi:hypothetical protein
MPAVPRQPSRDQRTRQQLFLAGHESGDGAIRTVTGQRISCGEGVQNEVVRDHSEAGAPEEPSQRRKSSAIDSNSENRAALSCE